MAMAISLDKKHLILKDALVTRNGICGCHPLMIKLPRDVSQKQLDEFIFAEDGDVKMKVTLEIVCQ